MKFKHLPLLAVFPLLLACGAEPATSTAGINHASAPASPPEARSTAFIQANFDGGIQGAMKSDSAYSAAKYDRYHLNFAGPVEGREGAVVIAFARTDTATPVAGRYTLGEQADFDGSVDFMADDVSFVIVGGELVIDGVRGDFLNGRFSLRAVERVGDAAIEVAGEFQTRPAS